MMVWLATFVLLSALCVSNSVGKQCKVDHTWRPFYGDIPPDALIAGYNQSGSPIYVLQITPPDQYLWSTPIQYTEGQNIRFGWYQSHEMEIKKFIKILCYDEDNTLQWVKVHKINDEVVNKCCLVEAGFGKYGENGREYTSRIGRVINSEGVTEIGRAYDLYWPGVHLGSGFHGHKVLQDFEVLAYGCNKNVEGFKSIYFNLPARIGADANDTEEA